MPRLKTYHTFTSDFCPTCEILNPKEFSSYDICIEIFFKGALVDILEGVHDYFEDNGNKSMVSLSDCTK